MAASQAHMEERLKLAGIRALKPAAALHVLEQLLRQRALTDRPYSVAVVDLIQRDPHENPQRNRFRETLRVAESAERGPMLENYLRQELASVLGASSVAVSVEQPLSTMGIDSLMAVELRTKIQSELGVVVPIARVLEGPTLRQLTALLLEQLTAQWLTEASGEGEEWEVLTI